MTQERRVWMAAALSAMVLVAYAHLLRGQVARTPTTATQTPTQAIPKARRADILQLNTQEDVISLESSQIRLEIGKSSAAVLTVTLKLFQDMLTKAPLKFGGISPAFSLIQGDSSNFDLAEQSRLKATWRSSEAQGAEGKELVIELDERQPVFTVRFVSGGNVLASQEQPVKIQATWNRGDAVTGQYNLLEAVLLTTKDRPWQRTHLRYTHGTKQPASVPRGTSFVTLSERYFCQSLKLNQPPWHATLLPAPNGMIAVELEPIGSHKSVAEDDKTLAVSVYIGPRDFFRLRDAGFEQAFSLGALDRIGLVLALGLKAIASVTKSYGISIVLLACLVTAMLSPFTIISFRSMKKLQELQPKLDQLKKKYEHDPQRMNQATFALFKEHKASPLSGCLPMLLQLPVFFALWSAISHVVELRGHPFLWIKDLSLPDRLLRFPGGIELNILPILMAALMYAQTKMSQAKMPSQATKTLFSGPMMSVLWGVMFYQVPSSLVLYWVTNSLVSIVSYKLAKT